MTVQIGRSIPRLEARAKVTGRIEYAHNLRLPGMLYGKLFRSAVAHGRIRAIDTSAAAAMAGVVRVVTGEDIRGLIPSPYYGPAFHDQHILALDKVRYVGEPVAAVFAIDPYVAEDAADLVAVAVEELPVILDAGAAPGEFEDGRSTELVWPTAAGAPPPRRYCLKLNGIAHRLLRLHAP